MTEPRKTPRCDAIKEYQFPSICYALEIDAALARHRAKQEVKS